MRKVKLTMDFILKGFCEAMICLMTAIAVYQVVARYVFNSPSSYSEELLTYSFAWTAMLATTLVFGERDHMRLGFFADQEEGKRAVVLSIAVECLIFIFAVLVLIYGGISLVGLTMTQTTATLGIPMGYVYLIMPVSGFLTAVYCILNVAELCGNLKG